MKTFSKKWCLAIVITALTWVALASPAAAQQGLDDELQQYWATEREMDVLRDRLFQREGRFGVGLHTGLLSSDPFFYYIPVGLRATYNLSNYLGFEVGGAYMDLGPLTNETELTGFLRERRSDAFDPARHTQDRYLWRANVMAIWSPLYGKLAVLQRKLAHFDLNVGAGFGAVGLERPALNRQSAFNHTTMEFVVGGGAHFYITNNVVVRLDGRAYLYRGAELPNNEGSFFQQLKFPAEFLLGATYLF